MPHRNHGLVQSPRLTDASRIGAHSGVNPDAEGPPEAAEPYSGVKRPGNSDAKSDAPALESQTHPPSDHWVYQCLDADSRLLYVGLTSCGLGRFAEGHARTAEWWPEVARIEIEHFDTRAQARTRERRLIRRCAPLHNIADQALRIPRPPSRVTTRWIDERELATWLDVERPWIERRLREGMPAARIDGALRFKAAEVHEWLAAAGLFEEEA